MEDLDPKLAVEEKGREFLLLLLVVLLGLGSYSWLYGVERRLLGLPVLGISGL